MTEYRPMWGKCSNLFVDGLQLVWWDYNGGVSRRAPVVCPACGLAVEGTLVEKRDRHGVCVRCADCWRRDGATDR